MICSHVLPYLPSWWAAAENESSNEKEAAATAQKIMAAEAAARRANRAMEDMEAQHAQALAQLSVASTRSAEDCDQHGSDQSAEREHFDQEEDAEAGPAVCDDVRYVALFERDADALAQLETLDLSRCDPALTDWDIEDSLEVLEEATLLAEIDLSYNQLTDECLQPLWCAHVCRLICECPTVLKRIEMLSTPCMWHL